MNTEFAAPYKSTRACDVKVGDVIMFDNPRYTVTIEQIDECDTDGWIMFSANDETWTLFLKQTDTIRVMVKD
jgi:hypothetical protein